MLKQSSLAGLNTVWFQKFSINLSDMAYCEEKIESIQGVPALPDLTPLEQEQATRKLQEIRTRLKRKFTN